MTVDASTIEAIRWLDDRLLLLDQRALPHRVDYIRCDTAAAVADAVRAMVVRGAPAIGVAAAYGCVLAATAAFAGHGANWRAAIEADMDLLAAARPTAVNLAWAIARMRDAFPDGDDDPSAKLLSAAQGLHAADVAANIALGDCGAAFLEPRSAVITHCNAGALATAGYGTALGVIRSAWRDGKLAQVYATETRPWLQGARLTAWELRTDGIPVTLMTDHAAAAVMRNEQIAWVITGADRIAANGDVANKIGTYALALAARAHGVRFMVAAPTSTIDRASPNGDAVPIETRSGEEVLEFNGQRTAPLDVSAFNPVFDITPANLIDVLVTECGAVTELDSSSIAALFTAPK